MKINRVEMAAFGPFKEPQSVDFEAFANDGVYLISGKTGAGKTSILDAICFGLYGSAPRYEDVAGAEVTYRSHYADLGEQTKVAVEFSAGTERYRVERAPEYLRPAKRGGGVTTEKARAALYQWRDDQWIGLVTGINQVENTLSGIRPLTRSQFLQVMLLAQNRFQEFLVADTESRNKVLQQLFQTRRFEDYETELKSRRSEIGAALADIRKTITGHVGQITKHLTEAELEKHAELIEPENLGSELTEALAEVVAGEHAQVASAAAEASAAAMQHEQANATLNQLLEIRRQQQRRATALAELAELDTQQEAKRDWAQTIAAAGRAERAWPAVMAAEKALQQSATASEAVLVAQQNLTTTIPPEASIAVLRAQARTHTEAAGALLVDVEREHSLAALATAAATAEADLTQHDQDAAATTQQVGDLERALAELGEQIATARLAASALEQLEEAVAWATDAQAAAERADAVQAQLLSGRQELTDLVAATSAAERARQDLWTRRIADYAGTLAGELSPGQPCPVCGGLEHPHPADLPGDPVTDEDMDCAEQNAQTAADAASTAAQAVGALERELAELSVKSDGKSAQAWQHRLDEVVADRDAALAAQRTLGELSAAQTQADADLARRKAQVSENVVQRTDLARRQAAAATELALATEQVEAAKGEFETVAARHAATVRQAETLTELVRAREQQAAADQARQQAEQDLAAALATHQFDDAIAVQQARRSDVELAELTERIEQLSTRRAGAEAILAELAAADLPTELVDVTEATQLLTAAQEQLTAANRALGSAQQRAATIAAAAQTAQQQIAAAAELQERYEVVEKLANTVQGKAPNERNMRLVDFVLAAELEDIAEAANLRLKAMSHGRYELQQDDTKVGNSRAGLGLKVLDLHTGELRTTNSLSGGEKFLASLALALGLAETVSNRAGGIALDTLFIDEGFGSLDPETLEVAMATLDELRTGGRTVGVISHVPAMQEAIAAKLEVEVVEGGWSRIRIPGAE